MAFSTRGRYYEKGKPVCQEIRGQIIDCILENGGDRISGQFPGEWKQLGQKFAMEGSTVKRIWEKFVSTGSTSPKPKVSGNPPKLKRGELQLIETIKTFKPSISSKHIQNELLQHGNLPTGISRTAVNYATRNFLSEGKWSWKRMTRNVTNKFTPANINYCQDYLNYMCQVNPYRLKFFDESGVSLYDTNKRYGHSLVNSTCIEVGRYMKSPNITLNLLAGLDGVLYANTLQGASDTLEFLNFFHEAAQAVQPNGNPALMAGDIVVLDNCATHHNRGGFILGQYLDMIGVDVVYLPTYSPEFNPVEEVFQVLKVLLKREEMSPLVNTSLDAAIYRALDEITPHHMQGFYRDTGYIFI